MIESSQIRFILCENKDFLTKQNDQTVPPHIQNLQTKQTETFPLLHTTLFCPLHPTLLRGLEVNLAVLVIRKFRVRVSSQTFWRSFAKLQKREISYTMYVRPSVRTNQLDSLWTDFHEVWYLSIFRKAVGEIQFHQNRTRTTGILHEDAYTFFIISRSTLLSLRNVLSVLEKIKTHIVCSFNYFFF
jgi:hypothetical protein